MSLAQQRHNPEDTPAAPGSKLPGAQPELPVPEPPPQLTVEVRDAPEAAVVRVAGEIDLVTAPQLAAALDEVLRTNARHIAIDLTEITFMDSAGVHTLVQTHQRAGRHVAVICGPGPALRTLELLGLTESLNVVSSRADYKLRRSWS